MKRDNQLRRLSNDALSREREYTWRQYLEASARLRQAASAMMAGENHTPLWMLRSDLDQHLERLENICFENEYRQTI